MIENIVIQSDLLYAVGTNETGAEKTTEVDGLEIGRGTRGRTPNQGIDVAAAGLEARANRQTRTRLQTWAVVGRSIEDKHAWRDVSARDVVQIVQIDAGVGLGVSSDTGQYNNGR